MVKDETIFAVKALLESDSFEMRAKLIEVARENRDLFLPRYNISLDDSREIALQRLKAIASKKAFSVLDFENDARKIFSAHEVVALLDPSVATKLTVQFNLFGGTVLRLGTEKHRALVNGIDSLTDVGCFGLTELGFGNNAIEMETTATLDETTREWVINSPTIASQKYWITNGACHAHWCVVMAQTLIRGKNEGVHPFLVRIRDPQLRACPGVLIEDMGVKMGVNGIDNAKLAFEHVRAPLDALLDSVSTLCPKSLTLTSRAENRRRRFVEHADQLISGRLCIASFMNGASKLALQLASRFAATRLGAGVSGRSDTPILEMQLQQLALAPLMAGLLSYGLLLVETKELYRLAEQKARQLTQRRRQEGTEYKARPSSALMTEQAEVDELRWQVAVLADVVKPLCSWHAERVTSICRERCGGQGYLASNQLGELLACVHVGCTAEGDNAVLCAKVTKEVMDHASKGKYQPRPSRLDGKLQGASFGSLEWISSVLLRREQARLKVVVDAVKAEAAAAIKNAPTDKAKAAAMQASFFVFQKTHAGEVQAYARAFGQRRAFEALVDAVHGSAIDAPRQSPHLSDAKTPQGSGLLDPRSGVQVTPALSAELRGVLSQAAVVFGLSLIEADGLFLTAQRIVTPEDAQRLPQTLKDATIQFANGSAVRAPSGEVSPAAAGKGDVLLRLANALGLPEDLLSAPIALDWREYNDMHKPQQGEVLSWLGKGSDNQRRRQKMAEAVEAACKTSGRCVDTGNGPCTCAARQARQHTLALLAQGYTPKQQGGAKL